MSDLWFWGGVWFLALTAFVINSFRRYLVSLERDESEGADGG